MTVNRVPEFPYQLGEYLNEFRRSLATAPIYLGGSSGSGGGVGLAPGGAIGQLVQTLSAYDTTEAATPTTSSGSSILDNLNHIRYQVSQKTGITDTVSLTNQGAAVGSTNFNSGSLPGLYRLSYYLFIQTAGSSAGFVTTSFAWNDGASKTFTSGSVPFTTTSSLAQGVVVVRLGSGFMSYSTTLSGTIANAKYGLYIAVEELI